MTDDKHDLPAESEGSELRNALRVLGFIAALVLALLIIAFTAGFVAGMTEDGHVSGRDLVALGIAFVLLAGTAWLIKRTWPDMALPDSPRMRSNRLLLYVTMGFALLLGIATAMLSDITGAQVQDILSNRTPLPQPVALFLLAGMLVVTILSIRWHALLDEHERAAYDFGGIAALYAYFVASVGWWLAWRGGMLPEPDGYAIFLGTMSVWAIARLIRRYF